MGAELIPIDRYRLQARGKKRSQSQYSLRQTRNAKILSISNQETVNTTKANIIQMNESVSEEWAQVRFHKRDLMTLLQIVENAAKLKHAHFRRGFGDIPRFASKIALRARELDLHVLAELSRDIGEAVMFYENANLSPLVFRLERMVEQTVITAAAQLENK